MKENTFEYLLGLQYLGFRYSGWQKQPGQRTVESMLRKTLKFVRPKERFKVLASGRTDAKVSALGATCSLISEKAIRDLEMFMAELNRNLPPDIRALHMMPCPPDFNIIQSAIGKEYVYLFAFGAKSHPFCAPFMANFIKDLDIEKMKLGAGLFMGTHNFSAYTARLQDNTKTTRTVTYSEIKSNTLFTANFFPKESYMFCVKGPGFIRYQIRMMMGALVQLGSGEMDLGQIADSLKTGSKTPLTYVAPGSGLMLKQVDFKGDS
ncbi:MAG: tRNA pseudouridine(38-40) synthase TruA [Bacteroidota bacterium]